MKTKKMIMAIGLMVLFMISLFTAPAFSRQTVTIVGTISGDLQLVTDDDQVYEIGDGEQGDELIKLVDKKVRVTGTVEDSEDMKTITVTEFEVLEE